METALQELRQSVRSLARRPGPALTIVATIGLAIGGATAIFSFVDGVLLRPLDFPQSERLVLLCETHPERGSDWCGASPANLADWTRASRTLDALGLARSWHFSLRREGRLESVRGGVATPGLVEVLSGRPALGRTFESSDLTPGSPGAVLLSHGFWQRVFGGDAGILGRNLELGGDVYSIVGVLEDGFAVPDYNQVELWVSLWPDRADARGWRGFRPLARLAPGYGLLDAQAELNVIAERLARQYPDTNAGWGVSVESLHERTVRGVKPALLALLGAVLLVLLIASANVANLLLARATVRERELAVRAALGAAPLRLARQLSFEGLLLAAAGVLVGSFVAVWTVALFVRFAPAGFPRLDEVAVDLRALAFGCLAGLAMSVLFSLAPILRAARLTVGASVQEGRSLAGTREGGVVRGALVVCEVALTLVLLVGGGLLARSFHNLLDWAPGFEPDGLVMVQVFPPEAKYPEGTDLVALYQHAVQDLGALPGVVAAGAGSAGPLFGGDGAQELYLESRPEPPAGEKPEALWYDVGPGYFETLGIPVLSGRSFSDRDGPGSPPVAIVNQALVSRYLSGENPLGQRLRLVAHEMTVEIVGVVPDVAPFLPGEPPEPEIYWPYMQVPRGAIHLMVRSATPPAELVPQVRARLAEIDPDLVLGRAFTMADRVERQLVTPRFNAVLLGGFALLATAIAAVGVYGVVAFAVSRRTREIGVRMALGAQRRDVIAWVLKDGARLAGFGVALGLAGAAGLGGLLRSLLVEVEPADPPTLAVAATVLAALALVATLVPAWRASRVDPATTLRHE
jgi:putative ABC transport system permease protein